MEGLRTARRTGRAHEGGFPLPKDDHGQVDDVTLVGIRL